MPLSLMACLKKRLIEASVRVSDQSISKKFYDRSISKKYLIEVLAKENMIEVSELRDYLSSQEDPRMMA